MHQLTGAPVELLTGDIVDMHHVGLGLMLTGADNPLRDTYLEIGYGRNDLFQENKRGRLKIDGYLSMAVGDTKNVRPFIQMTVDADGKSGADSIQVYLGIDLAVDKLFKK